MSELLIVIDMQNDFITGSLGNERTQAVVDPICNVIDTFKDKNIPIIYTLDTHHENYLNTQEGRNLPVPHCIEYTEGWKLNSKIKNALSKHKTIELRKKTFGSELLPKCVKRILDTNPEINTIKLVGVCTEICVVSNALLLKAFFPELKIIVSSHCCAGVTKEAEDAAISVMKSCQIIVE